MYESSLHLHCRKMDKYHPAPDQISVGNWVIVVCDRMLDLKVKMLMFFELC
jgi:hypothetical protein